MLLHNNGPDQQATSLAGRHYLRRKPMTYALLLIHTVIIAVLVQDIINL